MPIVGQRLAEQGFGLFQFAASAEQDAEIERRPAGRRGIDPVQSHRLAVVRDRLIGLVECFVAEAQVVVRAGKRSVPVR